VPAHRLQPLVAPDSVVVVGATPREGAVGNEVLVNLRRGQFPGRLYGVNPRHAQVLDVACFNDLASLPEVPQHAIFATGDRHLERLLDEAIALGIPAATIYSSLVLEDDPALGERVAQKVCAAGMLLCGANGMGIYNFRDRFRGCGFDTREHPVVGNVVLLSQSGSGMSGILDCEERLDFLFAASVGQELSVGLEDYLDYVLDQPETGVVGLFLETSRRPEKLLTALGKAAARQIPVVALKTGRTQLAAQLALSHSGALAGDDAAWQAVFDRYGVQRVDDMDELATALILLSKIPVPAGPALPGQGIATLHDSGGERQLIVDLAAREGVPFATLSQATLESLEARLDPGLPAVNPLDAWGAGGADADEVMVDCFTALLENDATLLGAVVHDRAPGGRIYTDYIDYLERAHAVAGKPVCLVSARQGTGQDDLVVETTRRGFPVLDGVAQFLVAVRCLLDYRAFLARPALQAPVLSPVIVDNLRAQLADAGLDGALGEHLSTALLAECGLTMNAGMLVHSREELAAIADSLHYPVVLKTAAGIAHKTEADGVILGIDATSALLAAYDALAARLGPQVYIAPMIDAPGVEMILGASRDAQFGPLVIVGFGGIHAETLADVAVLAAPFDAAAARRALDRLSLRSLLDGARGAGPVDIDSYCEMAARLSSLVYALRDVVREVDINPVKVGPWGALGLDALVVCDRLKAAGDAPHE
jgi:acyl-CoA synthetase (NDP forming)